MYSHTIIAGLLFTSGIAHAQIDSLKMNMDLRTRGELDNGVKTLIAKRKSPETTVASRARFGIDYYYQKLEVYVSVQDVRTWGETNSVAAKNQNLTLHEAWAKYPFSEKFAVKLGRQTLAYDNERLMGALDWAMQGRSFDALKGIYTINQNSKMEAVLTYNNDDSDTNDLPDKEIYSIADGGEITKSLQVIHYQFSGDHKFLFSAIAMNTVLQNPSGTHYDMITVGVNSKKYVDGIGFFGSAYYQTGKNTGGQTKNAYELSFNADCSVLPALHLTAGAEWLSGNNYNTEPGENQSFSPLYGTNHLYNGLMDYFYSGTSHFNTYGLNDYYLTSALTLNSDTDLKAALHSFTTNGKVGYDKSGNNLSSYLGTELDLIFTKKIGKIITANLGHSFMLAGSTMEVLKNNPDPKKLQTWTWLAFKINPNFRLK
ncbi:alginate export family protein [Chryseobacterium cheonjiense]|uniref:Alginate export family protein n=1 Tax=Chryseobacterium cheonjiense TaxID=2728845 RepID=A0A7Y0A4T9_9FLAO|nr:alginate export family protein [Chryseobacterium cheonjiense]NML56672.1 alginate export family protein [Chryseobacterium cheonjiense]